jgi:predicted ATPase
MQLAESEMPKQTKEEKVRELIIAGRKKIQGKEYSEAIKMFTLVLE